MKDKPKVLAVIVARGGSKRLPGKNMMPIGDRPMVYFSILAAQQSKNITHIAVSTDSDEIGEYCSEFGIEYIKRPVEISGDDDDISEAVRHAASKFEGIDYVVTLQAAVPFRPCGMIDSLLDEVIANKSGGGLSMVKVAPWVWERTESGLFPHFDSSDYPRSQDLPAVLSEVNAVQVAPIDAVLNGERWRFPLSVVLLPDIFAADIDDLEDYEAAVERWKIIKCHYFEGRDYVTFTDKVIK